MQNHPKVALDEIAGALRRQAKGLLEAGRVRTRSEVDVYADELDALHREPGRRDIAWRLGLDEQVPDEARRLTELRNFIEALVEPHRASRV